MAYEYQVPDRTDPLVYRGKPAVFTLKARPGVVFVNLTDSQYNSMGALLHHLYYFNSKLCDLAPSELRDHYIGYPHNGGEHTCEISGSAEDLSCYLEMLIEDYTARNVNDRYTAALKIIEALNAEVKTLLK